VSNVLPGDRGRARALLEQGKIFYRDDKDEQAVAAFQEAIKIDPDLAEARFRLGLGYAALGKHEEAEAEYKKAVEVYKKYLAEHDDDSEAHYDLGQTYAGLGQYSDAIREYREATKLKDNDADMYYDLGVAYTKLAQYDAAVNAFSKSLEIDPDNYRAQDGLDEAKEGVARIRAGRKHQEDLFKKQQKDELKKAGESDSAPATTPTPGRKPPVAPKKPAAPAKKTVVSSGRTVIISDRNVFVWPLTHHHLTSRKAHSRHPTRTVIASSSS
jgi:tetratricopeptide (TPR) repeat protein